MFQMKKNKTTDEDVFYQNAFSRNIGLLSEEEQEKLRNGKIAIAGLGGVGGVYLLNLTRTGIGNFNIADFDIFETVNINRQVGADINSLGRKKAKVMEEMAKSINPYIVIQSFAAGINKNNIDEFLKGADVVLDGLDFFNVKDRLLLFKKAREKNIPAITSAPIGFGASLLTFSPKGMSFEEYFDIKERMDEKEMLLLFGLGLSPSLIHRKYFKPSLINFVNQTAPSLAASTVLCANLVVCETVKIILDKKINPAPFSVQFDPYVQKYKKIYLRKGNKNWKQLLKKLIIKRKIKKLGNL